MKDISKSNVCPTCGQKYAMLLRPNKGHRHWYTPYHREYWAKRRKIEGPQRSIRINSKVIKSLTTIVGGGGPSWGNGQTLYRCKDPFHDPVQPKGPDMMCITNIHNSPEENKQKRKARNRKHKERQNKYKR